MLDSPGHSLRAEVKEQASKDGRAEPKMWPEGTDFWFRSNDYQDEQNGRNVPGRKGS